MNWNEYKFLTLNDLSDYESEINFLAGNKDVYVYNSVIGIVNPLGFIEVGWTLYFTEGSKKIVKGNEFTGNLEQKDNSLPNIVKIELHPYDNSREVLATYNCSEVNEDVNTTYLFDITDNGNNTTANVVSREIESLPKTWQKNIDRAKESVKYQLETIFKKKGYCIEDIVDKINNKDYFTSAIAYLTLSSIYSDLAISNNVDNVYSNKSISYNNKYKEFLQMIITLVELDTNDDGTTDYYPNITSTTLVI